MSRSTCEKCAALYVRWANKASGVLANPWAGHWQAAVRACGCRDRVQVVRHSATCGECGRVFDLLDEGQAGEWYSGHDCEAI